MPVFRKPNQSLRSITLAIFMLFPSLVFADTKVVTPTGVYAQIDTRLAIETMHTLSTGSEADKADAIKNFRSAPQNYAPPVFYALSKTLFEHDEKDEAMFWFYAGQLRARFDANRCADSTARQAVSVLNQSYGSTINQYAFKDVPKLEVLMPRVVEWDRKTSYNYDQRWINLHGMSAMLMGLGAPSGNVPPLSLPEAQWNEIAEKTRIDYLDGFKQAVAQMKATKNE